MHIKFADVIRFQTLVEELKKNDLEYFLLIGRNFMNLVKIMLILMPTSISAKHVFSVLDRVKTCL